MTHDVIIAGAGPAGSSAAAVLGEAGRKVLLLDKSPFPRDKTCGDGMTFKCLAPLRRLGLERAFIEKAQFATKGYSLFFTDDSELTVRRTFDAKGSIVYVLPRYEFDSLVLSAALRQASVEFVHSCKVRELVSEGERVVGLRAERDGEVATYRAPVVIDATGANSSLAVEVGAGNQDPFKCALAIRGYYRNVAELGDTVEFYFTREILPGYLWIFPTSPTSANVGCGTFQHIIEENRIDLRSVMADLVERHPVAARKLKGAELCGSLKGGKIPLAIDFESSRVRDGFIMIGDAASFTDPITAEGISYAMNSGIMAAEAVLHALELGDSSAAALRPYDEAWKRQFHKQFSRAPVLKTPLPKEAFGQSLARSFSENQGVDAAIGDLALQYELMFKLKALMKAL